MKNLEKLLYELKTSNDSRKAESAARALGSLKDPHSIEPLKEAALRSDWGISHAAIKSLAQFPDIASYFRPRLMSDYSHERLVAVKVLGEIADKSIFDRLVQLLQNEKENDQVKSAAAIALGNLADRRAAEPLIAALTAASSEVRRTAAGALGGLKDVQAVGPLGKAVVSDKEWNVRFSAAQSLGDIGDRRAVEALAAALEDEVSNIRSAAEGALSKLVSPAELEQLKQERKDNTGKGFVKDALLRFLTSERTRNYQQQNSIWWSEVDLAQASGSTRPGVVREAIQDLIKEKKLISHGCGYRAS